VQGLNLEAAGGAYDAAASEHVDDFLRTSNRSPTPSPKSRTRACTLVMVAGIGLRKLATVVQACPTQGATIKQAADAGARARAPASSNARATKRC